MRQYCLCLFICLLAFAFLQSSVMGGNGNAPDECCFNYFGRKIPMDKIISYIMTREDCTKPGIIFHTQRGKRICVDPRLNWVKKAMKLLDDRDLW